MKIHLGTDHAGFDFKNDLVAYLESKGYEVIDHGAHSYDADDDYPAFCIAAAQAVAQDSDSLGIVIGGSGNGEQIAANKVSGIRAALAWSVEIAKLAREHNNANVLGLGARMHDKETAFAIVDAFLQTPFSNVDRHIRRISQISDFEKR